MDARDQKDLEIANKSILTQKNGLWLVPSFNSNEQYTVDPNPEKSRCTCRDHKVRRAKCKHIFAGQFTIEQTIETTTTTKTADSKTSVTETVKVKRVTYKQEWSGYNGAQMHEKAQFQTLLYELCATVSQSVSRLLEQRQSIPNLPLSVAPP